VVAYANISNVTRTEYLEIEGSAESKSEYYDGEIVAMAGCSLEHERIASSIHGGLYAQLKGEACEPLTGNMRVSVPECNCYFYPDVSVTCSDVTIESIAGVQSVVNPILIVEVLSESTERIDREYKLICYQSLPSLRTYVIVATDKPLFQVFERQPDGVWTYTHYQVLDAAVSFQTIGCKLTLAEVYARVRFKPDSATEALRVMEERARIYEHDKQGTVPNSPEGRLESQIEAGVVRA